MPIVFISNRVRGMLRASIKENTICVTTYVNENKTIYTYDIQFYDVWCQHELIAGKRVLHLLCPEASFRSYVLQWIRLESLV